jgi:hypothetical protein
MQLISKLIKPVESHLNSFLSFYRNLALAPGDTFDDNNLDFTRLNTTNETKQLTELKSAT